MTRYESGGNGIRQIRLVVIVLVGRLIGWISRLRGHGGSSLPGLLAVRWHPSVLRDLRQRLKHGSVLITGTNGKTTTATIARQILKHEGWNVVSNHNGANLIAGLTTAFMQGSRQIVPRADLALLEVDEATMPRAGEELAPSFIVVTNVFRDQLDRYGELSTTLRYIQRGIDSLHAQGKILLNADDPQVAYLGRGRADAVYFGLQADSSADAPTSDPYYEAEDSNRCPRCGTPLAYGQRFYAHLGHYHCPRCAYERPTPSVTVIPGSADRTRLVGEFGELTVTMPIPGLYNLYNLAAAAALVWLLGLSTDRIPAAVKTMPPAFGRMEPVSLGEDTQCWIALVKNPVGFNQVLDTLTRSGSANVLVVINDRYADGRDVSWLWDVDFERGTLNDVINHWWVTGLRAWDMAIRLKYAGISETRISVMPSLSEALDASIHASRQGTLYILPTYTALLEVRELLTRRGLVKHFREG